MKTKGASFISIVTSVFISLLLVCPVIVLADENTLAELDEIGILAAEPVANSFELASPGGGDYNNFLLLDTVMLDNGKMLFGIVSRNALYGWGYHKYVFENQTGDGYPESTEMLKYISIKIPTAEGSSIDSFSSRFPKEIRDYMQTYDWDMGVANNIAYRHYGKVFLPTIEQLQANYQSLDIPLQSAGNYTQDRTLSRSMAYYTGLYLKLCKNDGAVANVQYPGSNTAFHLMTYVSEDFFKNIKLDVSTMGQGIKDILKNSFERDELEGLYTNSELKSIGFMKYVLNADFFSSDGVSPLTGISGNSSVTVRGSVINNSDEALSAPVIIAALYDETGLMIEAGKYIYSKEIAAYEGSDAEPVTLILPENANEDYVLAVYALDRLNITKAISDAIYYTGKGNKIPEDISSDEFSVNFDVESQLLTVSGTILEHALLPVTVFVFNPEKSDSDLQTGNLREVCQYIAQTAVADNGKYGFTYKPSDNTPLDKYSVKVVAEDRTFLDGYIYTTSNLEADIIEDFKAVSTADDIASIKERYGKVLDIDIELYDTCIEAGSLEAAAKAIAKEEGFTDSTSAVIVLNREMAVQKLVQAEDASEFETLVLKYNNRIGLDLENYINKSVDKAWVYSKLAQSEFIDVYDLNEKYIKYALTERINNVENYTEIKEILLGQRAVVATLGLDISVYDSFLDTTALDMAMADVYESWEHFAHRFEKEAKNIKDTSKEESQYTDGDTGSGKKNSGRKTDIVFESTASVVLPSPTENFGDLDGFEWAKESIEELARKGYINGRGNGIFCPKDDITREEFIKILVLAFELKSMSGSCAFADVDENVWYSDYICAAAENGITNGIGVGLFGVGRKITREEAAVFIYRTLKVKQGGEFTAGSEKFSDDAGISSYAHEAVYALKNIGVISGKEANMFKPADFTSRAETAKMIYAIIDK